jgi:hypothetical protein
MSFFKKIGTFLFGSASNVVKSVSDTVDKWKPSVTTRHKMALENEQAGDDSQADARAMAVPRTDHPGFIISFYNALIDGINRMVRPVFTFWVFGLLTGYLEVPSTWNEWPPMLWNIVWTIITFWFGSRLLFKDIPSMYKWYKNTKS